MTGHEPPAPTVDPVDAAYNTHCRAHPPPAAGVPGAQHAHYMLFVNGELMRRAREAATPEQTRGS